MRLRLLFFLFLFFDVQLNGLEFKNKERFFHVTASSCESKTRFYGDFERKTFVIAAYIVRSFLATQKESFIGLQINLCQLRIRLKEMLKNIYEEGRKKKYTEYKVFKSGLISTCILYYILIYFSRYYSEECEELFIKTHIKDPFLYTFLYDTTRNIDFDSIDELHFDLRIRESGDQFLNLEYPAENSFTILGLLCSIVPEGFHGCNALDDSLYETVQKLINRVFTARSSEAYLDITPEDLRDNNS